MLVDKLYIAAVIICAIIIIGIIIWSFRKEKLNSYKARWSYSWQEWEDPQWSDQHELSAVGGPPTPAECRRDKIGPDTVYLNLNEEAIEEADEDPELQRIKLQPRKAAPLLRASIPSEVNYVENLGACPADLVQVENAQRGRIGPGIKANASLRLAGPNTLKIDGKLDPVIIGDNGYVYKV